jgi:hypothetical protein
MCNRLINTLAIVISFSFANVSCAQTAMPNFRIETEMFTDPLQPPVKKTVTVFHNGIYYDESDGMTTVINPQMESITFIDPSRKIKSEVSLASLQNQIDQAMEQAPATMTKITTNAWTEIDSERVLTVGNGNIVYSSTVTAAPSELVARQYAEFADWSARLNAAFGPRLPPSIRLQMNRMLSEENVLPKKLTRKAGQNVVFALVTPAWELSDEDQQRVRGTAALAQEYTSVPAADFWAKE